MSTRGVGLQNITKKKINRKFFKSWVMATCVRLISQPLNLPSIPVSAPFHVTAYYSDL